MVNITDWIIMDPFAPKPNNSINETNNTRPQPPPLTAVPKPTGPHGRALWLGMCFLYILVLVVGIFSVYTWQNNKVTSAQKLATAAEAAAKLPNESSNIEADKYAAVFLTGGQVYFGKIDALNSQFVTLTQVYYLRTSNSQIQSGPAPSSAANEASLVKLGCELHGPTDKMVINRTQVSFWENLKNDGQVAKAIADYTKQNPAGQKCT